MSDLRTISKNGVEQQDIVQLLDELTGEKFISFSELVSTQGTPAVTVVGGTAGWALDAASSESLSAVIRVPESLPGIDHSEAVDFYIQWSAGATSGDVVFDLTVKALALGEDAGGAATALQVTDTAAGTADLLSESPVLSVAASTLENADLLHVKITRLGGDGSDTMTGDALLHGLRINYSTNPKIVS